MESSGRVNKFKVNDRVLAGPTKKLGHVHSVNSYPTKGIIYSVQLDGLGFSAGYYEHELEFETKPEPKFKVNDRVRIISQEFNKATGKIVDFKSEEHWPYFIEMDESKSTWNCKEHQIELETTVDKFEKGDIVRTKELTVINTSSGYVEAEAENGEIFEFGYKDNIELVRKAPKPKLPGEIWQIGPWGKKTRAAILTNNYHVLIGSDDTIVKPIPEDTSDWVKIS